MLRSPLASQPVLETRLLELLATTTSRFIIEPPSRMGDATWAMLRDIGQLFDIDRAYLFQILPGGATMSNTIEWCAPGVGPAIGDLQDLPVDVFPWWMEQMRADRAIRLLTLDDLPPEAGAERATLEPQGIQSLLVLPVAFRGEVVGFVGFDHTRSIRAWTDDEINVLRFIGSALAHALERQRVDLHLERAATVFESSREALLVSDGDRRIIEVNPAFTRMAGLGPSHVIGLGLVETLSALAVAPEAAGAMADAIHRCSAVDRELEVQTHQGSTTWWEVRGNPLHAPEGGYMVIASDISERKAAERLKSEFVATVSHELRTPLTAIAGALGLVTSGAVGPVHEDAGRILAIADRNLQRLTSLVNDLLEVEKAHHGGVALPMSELDVDALLDEAVECNQIFAARYDVTLLVADHTRGLAVHANAPRFQQVMTNLLSNAAKFSPPGSTVRLTAVASDDRVLISVIDRGPGIPREFQDRVFDRFAMADASDARTHSGTGLGLSIARSLAEQMNGTLDFESTPGRGSTFTVSLQAR